MMVKNLEIICSFFYIFSRFRRIGFRSLLLIVGYLLAVYHFIGKASSDYIAENNIICDV
jgi:hypothetical protein